MIDQFLLQLLPAQYVLTHGGLVITMINLPWTLISTSRWCKFYTVWSIKSTFQFVTKYEIPLDAKQWFSDFEEFRMLINNSRRKFEGWKGKGFKCYWSM